jgi:hypothetical protein
MEAGITTSTAPGDTVLMMGTSAPPPAGDHMKSLVVDTAQTAPTYEAVSACEVADEERSWNQGCTSVAG